jgi:hypothetical protein
MTKLVGACWHCGAPLRPPRGTEGRLYAAQLLRVARRLHRWQVEFSHLISRRDNSSLFQMSLDLEAIASSVASDYSNRRRKDEG